MCERNRRGSSAGIVRSHDIDTDINIAGGGRQVRACTHRNHDRDRHSWVVEEGRGSPRRSWTRDHLRRDEITWQVTNAAVPIKPWKSRGWDRRRRLLKGAPRRRRSLPPAYLLSWPASLVSLRAPDDRDCGTAGTGSSSRDPGATRSRFASK